MLLHRSSLGTCTQPFPSETDQANQSDCSNNTHVNTCETLYKCSARGNSVPLWRVCFCMSASRNEHVRSGSLGSSSSSSRVRLYWGGPANTNMWLVLLLKRHDICVNSDARVPCWGIQRPWCEVHFQGVLTPLSLSVSSAQVTNLHRVKVLAEISQRHPDGQREETMNLPSKPIREESDYDQPIREKTGSPEFPVIMLVSLHTLLLFSAHHIPLHPKHTHYTNY